MRKVKYRSWNKENKCFFYFINGIYFDENICNAPMRAFNWENAEQCTYVCDRNCIVSYEGDIGYSDAWNPSYQEIVFNRGGFCLKYDESGYYPDIKYVEGMRIVGNKHENPELMKRMELTEKYKKI